MNAGAFTRQLFCRLRAGKAALGDPGLLGGEETHLRGAPLALDRFHETEFRQCQLGIFVSWTYRRP